ncbi:MAG TPA: S8 family serine peptidase [Gaiellaceae bacterium]|nr:S8 family serine peptidase [Gaiellaceae bacterium]
MPTSEVIVTLKAPGLAVFGRSLLSARHQVYGKELAAAQAQAARNLRAAIPSVRIVWRYRIVADGFALVVPTKDVSRLTHITGVAKVWPNLTYHSLSLDSPAVIGADQLWGTTLATAGTGIKIGILDDGVDAAHPFLSSSGFSYPAGFPKGQVKYATPKVIVQRAFPQPSSTYEYADRPFDPKKSFHATHVAGIAAGDNNTVDGSERLSGVAPKAYIGNYKVLTVPTSEFGLDGNSAEIAAGIESAVSDGMNVINLSLGEPEIDPTRDFVVHAINGAAAAGVVPVVAAGNDFQPYGFGSISSPANASGAIAVAATTTQGEIASFSSAGPTPVSLLLKPDVSAPGVGITSSVPSNQGSLWETLQGTSMATPAVAGAAALLKEQHPDWTVAEIKSALVQTGSPVHGATGIEVPTIREGGGLIDVPKANNPLIFAAPTSIAFPVNGGAQAIDLTDAGGGAGTWTVAIKRQQLPNGVRVTASPSVTVPGVLAVTASSSKTAKSGDSTGFVVLTKGTETRRIPFWIEVDHPRLGTESHTALTQTGTYTGNTANGVARVSRYRYPTGGDVSYPGPEVVYQVTLKAPVANFGVAVTSGHAVPHVTYAGDESHLVGYTGLPVNLNPYFNTFGNRRPIAGMVRPAAGTYDVVFDTRSRADAGPFTFRYWSNDTTPPSLHIVSTSGRTIVVSATDAGAGIDPKSIFVSLDGDSVPMTFADGRIVIHATAGRHALVVKASDYQEAKNMEDVAPVAPNTSTLAKSVSVSS